MLGNFKDSDTRNSFVRSLILMSKEMHAESQFSNLDYDQSVFTERVAEAIIDPSSCIIGYSIDGKLAGALIGYTAQTYFGKDKIANCVNWYVRPEFRGSIAGIKLLREFENWATNKNAKRVYFGTSTKINTRTFDDIMCKLKYEIVGADYQKEI